jgi:hypothetical protein
MDILLIILVGWFVLATILVLAKGILHVVFWGILGIDIFGEHPAEVAKCQREKKERAEQREHERRLADQQHRDEAERRRDEATRKREDDRKRAEEAEAEGAKRRTEERIQTDREAARNLLCDFYAPHAELLSSVYPLALLQGFLRAEMHDGLEPVAVWAKAAAKIAELQPVIVEERRKRADEDERTCKRALAEQERIADIRACELLIERLERAGGDEQEINDQQRRLRRLREVAGQSDIVTTKDL